MTYYICQNLLNITRVHWNQYRSCVPNGILSFNSYYIAVCCVNTVNSMWIFCMHGMPGLPATFAEIWCMHLKTLRGILFPRTQRAPCDVSSSKAWMNWRQGIVIINVTLVYVRIYTVVWKSVGPLPDFLFFYVCHTWMFQIIKLI